MPPINKGKEEHRYYLLPGMGRSNRRRRREILKWAIIVGVVISVLFGLLLWSVSRP
ncbi:MAG: hypothetical protein HYY24_23225 [Verrucomicrobia bacterium]|nr:hypothetical protein [Verrucomicrobiota bacterium]